MSTELRRLHSQKEARAARRHREVIPFGPSAHAESAQGAMLQMALVPATVGRILVVGALCFIAAGIVVEFGPRFFGDGVIHEGIVKRLNLDAEANLPTWYSSSLLGVAALLLAGITAVKRMRRDRYTWHWAGLMLLFVYMSADETACLHEGTLKPLRAILHTSGLFYITYVIPGLIVVALLAVTYYRFLQHLPARTRRWLVATGALYVGGALGMEMLEGRHEYLVGIRTAAVGVMTTVEESSEMLAVALFIYALLSYLASQAPGLTLCFGRENPPDGRMRAP